MTICQDINCFQTPYRQDASPYGREVTFDWKVIDYCDQQKLLPYQWTRSAKCILVGDVGVGKTSLLKRSSCDEFTFEHKDTIGVDFEIQKFSILGNHFDLQIWDTAGQERFRSLASSYFRGSNVALIVFDLTNVKSLLSTLNWSREVLKCTKNPIIFLVGSKSDAVSPAAREFNESEAMKIAERLKAEYWSVSARTGENVIALFHRISCLTFQKIIRERIEEMEAIKSSPHLTVPVKSLPLRPTTSIITLNKKKKVSTIKNCLNLRRFYKPK
ncbi:ras-related protein Rab-34-like [Tetranychus urticae]|uniref:Ras-related protein Rab-34 n=1 Tax=Tetranychus urticae TaxID=32264 RepID=T1K238_TETUR|nr:ras-related protein Rab-34-like [Tetranychus urticae]